MVTIVRNGISLSAHAVLNGARNAAPRHVEFSDRPEGRERRQERRNKRLQRSFLSGM
jgi:hypothetical protein